MKITEETLPKIQADETAFIDFFGGFAIERMASACLHPMISRQRVVAAYGAWVADLKRIECHEKKLSEGLDHFKRCGHLTYWVRRLGPVIDAHDPFNTQDSYSAEATETELALRKKMFGFWNEYIAFELGFQFCKFYEVGQENAVRGATFFPSIDYYDTMCQFLKFKNVSPHALFLIFKSLFAK